MTANDEFKLNNHRLLPPSGDPDAAEDWLPEHALWVSVVRHAVMDYLIRDSTKDPRRLAHRESAANWLFSDSPEPHSLCWIAEHCSPAPKDFVEAVRAWANRLRANRAKFPGKVVEQL